MNAKRRPAVLVLSTVMATLGFVQIGTADFALAGKEQFKRSKPHVNVTRPQQGGQPVLTSKQKRQASWLTYCIESVMAQGTSQEQAIYFCLHPGDNN
jgi:hypothetical protein